MKRRILSNYELNTRIRETNYISSSEDLSYDIEGFLEAWIKQAYEDYEGSLSRFTSYCIKTILKQPYYHSGVPEQYYYEMQDNLDMYEEMIVRIAKKYS